MTKQGHIFISYQSSEVDFALRIAADLRNSGAKVWMDRLDMGILPSQDWRLTIQNALTPDKCSGMIAILSPAYLASHYCRIELGRADRLDIPIYPLILSSFPDTEWPLEVERLQYIDFKEWLDDNAYQSKLIRLLETLKQKFPDQFVQLPDPETRYLTKLIAELEARQGVTHYVELEAESTKVTMRPSPPVDEETGYLVLIPDENIKPKKRKQIHIKKISNVIDTYPRLVLTGDPGAGKTTVIRNMALDLARKKLNQPRTLPIPMIVNLAQWQDDLSLEEFLKAKWPLDSNPLDLLEKGDLLLYLDGLNEMGAEKSSKIALLRLWLSKSSSFAQLIVTCRAADYNEDLHLENLPVVNIKELNESQIRKFARRYLGSRAKNFLQQVLKEEAGADNKRGLFQLLKNPYFLTAFMIIYDSTPNEELPRNSGTLFRKLVLALWTREERRKPNNIPFETAELEFARLAFAMVDSDMPVEVSRDYALLLLRDKEFLSVGQSASYLISQNNGIRFYHQLIQEYFAAIGLDRVGISHIRLDQKPLQRTSAYSERYWFLQDDIFEKTFGSRSTSEYRRSSKWDQVIISLCGFTFHPEEIIKKVARIDPLLAVDCLSSGVKVPLDKVMDAFIEAFHDEDATLRKAALSALVKISGEEAILFAAEALEDTDREVRKLSTNFLVRFQEPAIPYLINHLKTTSGDKAELTIQALAAIGAPVVPILGDIATNESNIVTRLRACKALGETEHKDSNAILLSLLRSKEEELVKASIEGIRNIADASSAPELIDFLNTVPKSNIDLRVAVVNTLGSIKNPQAVPILVNLITDESWKLHSAALSSLKKISTPEALLPVRTFELLNARNSGARRNAVTKIEADYGVIGLLHGLRSRSNWEIAYQLAKLPKNEFEVVLKELDNDNHRVRAMIAYCIGKRNDKIYESQLMTLLDDRSSFVRGIASDTLGELKSESAIPKLAKKLHDFSLVYSDSKQRVCDAAALALLRIGTEEALAHLKSWASVMINRRISEDQTSPLTVLEKVGGNETVPRLAKILRSKNLLISNHARRVLKAIGTPEALEAIVKFDNKNRQ